MAIGPWVSTVSPELLAIMQPEFIRLLYEKVCMSVTGTLARQSKPF
jgi:hypothetical protein